MAYAPSVYTGDGSTTNFAITWSYLDSADVDVFVDGVATAFAFLSTSLIQITPAPAVGKPVRIERHTNADARDVVFPNGNSLTASQLNKSADQLFYLAQEAVSSAADAMHKNSADAYEASGRKINHVADPADAQDAATKHYVDTGVTSQVAIATGAASSATASATTATGAATTATNKAAAASASADAADTSAIAADTKASAAAASASAAATSATAAANSASAAAASEQNVAGSAASALTSKEAAAASATSAAQSATTAQNGLSGISAAQQDAAASKDAAAASATAAATSATNAASSANAAGAFKTQAATSETNAAQSASTATTARDTALSSASQASEAAQTATNAATTATTNATSSGTYAGNAQASATAAANSATSASNSASSAASSASSANTAATSANDAAAAAASSASSALAAADAVQPGGMVLLATIPASGFWVTATGLDTAVKALLVLGKDITLTANNAVGVAVSGDGTTFENPLVITPTSAGTTLKHQFATYIYGTSETGPKHMSGSAWPTFGSSSTGSISGYSPAGAFVAQTNPTSGLRISAMGGTQFTGGTLEIYGIE